MANGNSMSLWDDMPWWVKAIALVGVPSLISLGVIYSDRVQLSGAVDDNRTRLERLENLTTIHDGRVWVRFEELSQATRETNRILSATCVNAATTMEARERCVGAR